jgi:hypothetical protein
MVFIDNSDTLPPAPIAVPFDFTKDIASRASSAQSQSHPHPRPSSSYEYTYATSSSHGGMIGSKATDGGAPAGDKGENTASNGRRRNRAPGSASTMSSLDMSQVERLNEIRLRKLVELEENRGKKDPEVLFHEFLRV